MQLSKIMITDGCKPKIYLLPTLLGEDTQNKAIPPYNIHIIEELEYFCVENEKSARRFIKTIAPEKVQASLKIEILNKHTSHQEIKHLLNPLFKGYSIGVLSDAGMPGIADPGALLVREAHHLGYAVVPLTGPSSLFLALAASGFNGQFFSFHGYLPIDKQERKNALKKIEQKSTKHQSAEIFIETPYRNNKMIEDLYSTLRPSTSLCVACDITLPSEYIRTKTIKEWRKEKVDLHKRPSIFIIQA